MGFRNTIGATALAASLMMLVGGAALADDAKSADTKSADNKYLDAKYPNFNGIWRRASNAGLLAGGAGGLRWDDSQPPAATPSLGQQPPLTREYQTIYELNLADMSKGGQGIDPTYSCLSPGMPRVMIAYSPMEFVVTPAVTYILMERDHDHYRRIYTDGRDYPSNMALEPRYLGYSIGKWLDEDGDGRYDVLQVETRGMKGPRVYDATGIPLHADNETIVRERIYLDKADANLLHDDITTNDHALTKPWLVKKTYRRVVSDKPIWVDHQVCGEGNAHVGIGGEVYYLSGDGLLMPAMKDQPAPDLRYFKKYNR